MAAYITVFEEKHSIRGDTIVVHKNEYFETFSASPAERAEHKQVRNLYSSTECIRESVFSPFKIEKPTGALHCLSIRR